MPRTLRLLRRLTFSIGAAVAGTLIVAAPVWAQVPDPAADASLPGGALITQVLGWLKYAALASAVAGLLIGGISMGVGHFRIITDHLIPWQLQFLHTPQRGFLLIIEMNNEKNKKMGGEPLG